jgi:hypothetical protein
MKKSRSVGSNQGESQFTNGQLELPLLSSKPSALIVQFPTIIKRLAAPQKSADALKKILDYADSLVR